MISKAGKLFLSDCGIIVSLLIAVLGIGFVINLLMTYWLFY